MTNLIKSVLKICLFIGIGFFLIWLVVKDLSEQDKKQIFTSFTHANYYWVLISVIIGLLAHVFRALRWKLLLEPLDYRPSSITTFYAVMIGYLANLAVPRLGEVTRCSILLQHEKIPLEKSLGTVVAERIIDTLTLFVFIGVLLLWQLDVLYSYLAEKLGPVWHVLNDNAVIYGVVLIILSALAIGAFRFLTRSQHPLIKKVADLVQGFVGGIITVMKLKKKPLFLFYSVAIWFCYWITIYINFMALSSTSILGMGAALSVLVLGSFAYILVQGGIGAYQLIAMETLLIYGIAKNDGLAFGWLNWTSQTLAIVVFGLLAFGLLAIKKKKVDLT